MKLALLLMATLSLFGCRQTPEYLTCKNLRVGEFVFRPKRAPDSVTYRISRNDTIQIETKIQTHESSRFRVKWIDSCSYTLRLLSTTSNYPDSVNKQRFNDLTTVEVKDLGKDFYVFSVTSLQLITPFSDTIWVNDSKSLK